MAVTVKCPDCGHSTRVREEVIGRQGKCKRCDSTFRLEQVDGPLIQEQSLPSDTAFQANSTRYSFTSKRTQPSSTVHPTVDSSAKKQGQRSSEQIKSSEATTNFRFVSVHGDRMSVRCDCSATFSVFEKAQGNYLRCPKCQQIGCLPTPILEAEEQVSHVQKPKVSQKSQESKRQKENWVSVNVVPVVGERKEASRSERTTASNQEVKSSSPKASSAIASNVASSSSTTSSVWDDLPIPATQTTNGQRSSSAVGSFDWNTQSPTGGAYGDLSVPSKNGKRRSGRNLWQKVVGDGSRWALAPIVMVVFGIGFIVYSVLDKNDELEFASKGVDALALVSEAEWREKRRMGVKTSIKFHIHFLTRDGVEVDTWSSVSSQTFNRYVQGDHLSEEPLPIRYMPDDPKRVRSWVNKGHNGDFDDGQFQALSLVGSFAAILVGGAWLVYRVRQD